MTGCGVRLTNQNAGTTNQLCNGSVKTFSFNDAELGVLQRKNKEKALLINCTLHQKCGFDIPNPTICKQLLEKKEQ